MFEYKVVAGTSSHPDIGAFNTFDLEVYENGTLVQRQSDVSVEWEEVDRIACLCNAAQVEPAHLLDVIQDNI